MSKQDIKFDKRNYRKHSDRNKSLIKKSLTDCGAGRSILLDNDGEIIAGNGVYEQAQSLGMKVKVIETDGSEIIAVKRTDISTDDAKRKQLAIMDNSTSDTSAFDIDLLKEDFSPEELGDFGIAAIDFDGLDFREENASDLPADTDIDSAELPDEKYLTCPSCGHCAPSVAFSETMRHGEARKDIEVEIDKMLSADGNSNKLN